MVPTPLKLVCCSVTVVVCRAGVSLFYGLTWARCIGAWGPRAHCAGGQNTWGPVHRNPAPEHWAPHSGKQCDPLWPVENRLLVTFFILLWLNYDHIMIIIKKKKSLMASFFIIRRQFRTHDTIHVIALVKLQNINCTAKVYFIGMNVHMHMHCKNINYTYCQKH